MKSSAKKYTHMATNLFFTGGKLTLRKGLSLSLALSSRARVRDSVVRIQTVDDSQTHVRLLDELLQLNVMLRAPPRVPTTEHLSDIFALVAHTRVCAFPKKHAGPRRGYDADEPRLVAEVDGEGEKTEDHELRIAPGE